MLKLLIPRRTERAKAGGYCRFVISGMYVLDEDEHEL